MELPTLCKEQPYCVYYAIVKGCRDILRGDVISWALYDFANTIYSMNILSLYFAGWLVIDLGYQDIHYSIAFSASMLLAAILMPALGYLSDINGGGSIRRRLWFLLIFTVGTVVSVIGFSSLPAGAIALILVLFALSNFFYEGGMIFYNALLPAVSNEKNVGAVSGFGVALGYLGSIVGMILVLPFVNGTLFGWDVPFIDGAGKTGAFLPTAIFFAIFSIPLFIFVRERTISAGFSVVRPSHSNSSHERKSLKAAYLDIWNSLKATSRYPGLLRFLIADYFIEDAIATVIIFMGVYAEKVLLFDEDKRTMFFILSTLFAMIGAYFWGRLADYVQPKRVLNIIVIGWIIVLAAFAFNSIPEVNWALGPLVGIFLGGVWAVTRPILIYLAPADKLGEFFGLFSLSGRAAAIIGPVLWGIVVYLFSPDRLPGRMLSGWLGLEGEDEARLSYRLAILTLAIMMGLGLYILRKIPERKARV